jgi:hypothetical protein
MCSIEQRLKEIGQAIEDLAIQAKMPPEGEARKVRAESEQGKARTEAEAGHVQAAGALPGHAEASVAGDDAPADGAASTDIEHSAAMAEPDESSRILARLAELWGLLADLDPEVARRLAGYQALLSPGDLIRRRWRPPITVTEPVLDQGAATSRRPRKGTDTVQARAADSESDALACAETVLRASV